MAKRTKLQSKRALAEWQKFSESEFWFGLQELIVAKKQELAESAVKDKSEKLVERICRLQGRYEALHLDFPRIIENYIKELEKESD